MKIDKKILEVNGWVVECESPLEICHSETGSFATMLAAQIVMDSLLQPRDGCRCQSCGKIFGHDFVVSNEIWENIKPQRAEAGLLCGACIVHELERLSISGVWRIKKL